MSSSIFHFFKTLVEGRAALSELSKLDEFPFDENLLSGKRAGQFPDLAIKICRDNELFSGGELIELKDSKSYAVASFNSTIPTGTKEIKKLFRGKNSALLRQMTEAGDEIDSLPLRDVYYLIRGRKSGKVKIVLVHGSFFETVKVEELIAKSFAQVLDETLQNTKTELDSAVKEILLKVFSAQESFSKVRDVEKASVKLRFRVMTEVKAEGNVLNSAKYPEIADNTLNLIVPSRNNEMDLLTHDRMSVVFSNRLLEKECRTLQIQHPFNGKFFVFQFPVV